jgi:hypothetical protein
MAFRTAIQLGGKTATGFRVPEEVVEALGKGKRPPVQVTIGDHTYRSTMPVMGGAFMIPLSAENREAAGVTAGDEAEVRLEVDTEPREVIVPRDLQSHSIRTPPPGTTSSGCPTATRDGMCFRLRTRRPLKHGKGGSSGSSIRCAPARCPCPLAGRHEFKIGTCTSTHHRQ